MAMQAGIGLSRILLIVGAGYTGSIVLGKGRLSDILAELQTMVKGMEKNGDSAVDSDVVAQVRRLAMEVRQIASSRGQITVLNGGSSLGNASSLVVPLASAGALGYAYMWWKGVSFSDLMYVTKSNMASAVSNLQKHLESVTEALAKTKKHLTQRLQNLDDKLDDQAAMSRTIRDEVSETRGELSNIHNDLSKLESFMCSLDGKLDSLEIKQDMTCMGVQYLCNFVNGKDQGDIKRFTKTLPKPKCAFPGLEASNMMGLKQLTDGLSGGIIASGNTNATLNDTPAKYIKIDRSASATIGV
ncbi:hypothetical protein MKW98_022898 [Papaver atlanticum]|uniref:DUF1664 domain-containing protein n=1 Tax=Papaver atlanticum TaxID=357466 RepID=A0AAD4Y087_9MAGN|nr:hypothetical protein MKW98_022898 [Papaver atlanticum]